jgi:hypothetical protein
MAARALESRFERMSVNDENDPGDAGKLYSKSKVRENMEEYKHWKKPVLIFCVVCRPQSQRHSCRIAREDRICTK